MLPAETCDALIIGDQRTGEFDRGGNQKSVGRIAVLEMMQPVAAGSGPMAERHRLDAGTLQEALDPRLGGGIEIDASGVDK